MGKSKIGHIGIDAFLYLNILLNLNLFAQNQNLKTELVIIPQDISVSQINLLFQIDYPNLVFILEEGVYKAGIKGTLEIYSDDKLIERKSIDKQIRETEYSKTKNDLFMLQGLFQFAVPHGEYSLKGVFDITNTVSGFKYSKNLIINDSLTNHYFISPSDKINCDQKKNGNIAICNEIIPFSEKKYDLLMIVPNQYLNNPEIRITQFSSELNHHDSIIRPDMFPVLRECDGKIVFDEAPNEDFSILRLPWINRDLTEGAFEINLGADQEKEQIVLQCEWFDGPFSYFNKEKALKVIGKIFGEREMEEILDSEENNPIYHFWKKKDPTPGTSFNELMAEFFFRVDKASNDFKNLQFPDGSLTDLGLIYIKYGDPDLIEKGFRNSVAIQIWHYKKLNKEFVFFDSSGVGNYVFQED